MIRVVYGNISLIKDGDFELYLNTLPVELHYDIIRYVYLRDKKSRLLARMMLKFLVDKDDASAVVNNWQRDDFHKPFIPSWYHFNISHSGEQVVLAYSDYPIGIDIEEIVEIDYFPLISGLHDMEKKMIQSSDNGQNCFYDIWVKKEALLKAIGIGLTNKLYKYNCTDVSVNYHEVEWYFQQIYLDIGYVGYVCSPCKEPSISSPFFIENYLHS